MTSPRKDRPTARQMRRKPKDHGPLLNLVSAEHREPRRRPTNKELKPLSERQAAYDRAIQSGVITFGIGPAGTGKTWWAAARAAEALREDQIERIIVTRPAVEAGESLGFLPGELDEKYEPYFRPVRDALEEILGSGATEYMLKAGRIEARPLGLIRGATFKNAWVLLDEAQNTTPTQMKLFLTRIGENAKMIINGDLTQKDIPGPSGLADALDRLRGLEGVRVIRFGREDIVRSGMCQLIASRYETEIDGEASLGDEGRYIAMQSADDSGLQRMLKLANERSSEIDLRP